MNTNVFILGDGATGNGHYWFEGLTYKSTMIVSKALRCNFAITFIYFLISKEFIILVSFMWFEGVLKNVVTELYSFTALPNAISRYSSLAD
jgi:hypothetical protein